MQGTVGAVPVFGSDSSSVESVSRYFSRGLTERRGSGSGLFPEKRFRQFLFQLLGKTVPTVRVSGSSSVPGPSCKLGVGNGDWGRVGEVGEGLAFCVSRTPVDEALQ